MVTSSPVSQLCGLAKRLVMDGLLAEELAADAQQKALKKREPFVSHLVENKILDSLSIATSACQEFGTPLFDLAAMELEAQSTKNVGESWDYNPPSDASQQYVRNHMDWTVAANRYRYPPLNTEENS